MSVVILDVFSTYSVLRVKPNLCGIKSHSAQIALGMMIWAWNQDVLSYIGPLVLAAKRFDVVGFRIFAPIWKLDEVAANLTAVFVKYLKSSREKIVSNYPRDFNL